MQARLIRSAVMYTKDAVTYFKGKARLAAALHITPSAVSQWGTRIPMLRQYELQVITAGKLKAEPPIANSKVAA